MGIFITYKVTGCATRTTTEWLNSEHALASGLVIERPSPHLPHGELMKEAGPLVWPIVAKCEQISNRIVQQGRLPTYMEIKSKLVSHYGINVFKQHKPLIVAVRHRAKIYVCADEEVATTKMPLVPTPKR